MKRHRSFFRPSISGTLAGVLMCLNAGQAAPATLTFPNEPLFLTTNSKANVLVMYGNSNSMDELPNGSAIGSANAASKSEIARNAIKLMVTNYNSIINMGLLAFQQNPMSATTLNASQYDVSFDPAHYDPNYAGPRNGQTKKFRIPNPTSPGDFIHFNISLPFYTGGSYGPTGTGFCYAPTSCTDTTHDFKGTSESGCVATEAPTTGPWDIYNCYTTKIGSSNAAPDAGGGYSGFFTGEFFTPTDSDYAQGITDFGRRNPFQMVSQTWFTNGAPGKGYMHVPIALLDSTQAGKINTKLGTSQFSVNAPTDINYPLQNAGLTPLEGTILTANNYFNGTLSDSAQGGPLGAPPNSCGKNFLVMLTNGLPSVSQSGTPSSNTTQMLADVTAQAAALKASTAKGLTYIIGFALPYGVNPNQLDTIAVAGGTEHSYNANDPGTLNTAFASIFSDIMAKTAAASSVALNSQSISAGSRVFQAKFSSADWSGQLLSLPVNSDGTIGTAVWDAGQVTNTLVPTDRKILTYKPSNGKGIKFRWPNGSGAHDMDAAQSTALNTNIGGVADGNGSARLDYLRGSSVNEGTGLNFRTRPTSKLGDIISSAPTYVGVPAFNYNENDYADFREAKKNRTPMVYVGANDGMLHGFNANSGAELIAYVPSPVYPNLSRLTAPTYSHRYFVDGSPSSGDVYYSGAWHTVLVSGMGTGGRGVFGLDVTNPSSFSENDAESLVKFEYTNANDVDVGYISGQPSIVKLNNGTWAAIFGNGYNATGTGSTGHATLFIVNVQTGALIKKISTSVGSTTTPNALANPIAVDADGNGTADYVYAGDLQGNLWKFDISNSSSGSWSLAYKLYAAGQPITSTPDATRHPNGGYLVYFGTGKYLETADLATTNQNVVYGIWDNGAAVTSGLLQQSISGTVVVSGETYRTVSQSAIDWTTNKGWYINLPTSGERQVTDPIVRNGRLIFATMTPSSVLCSYGGSSWLMEVDYLTGGMLNSPPFDTNKDGKITAADTLVAGFRLEAIGSAPGIQAGFGTKDKPMEVKISNTSSGAIATVGESGSSMANRRVSWRELIGPLGSKSGKKSKRRGHDNGNNGHGHGHDDD